MRKSFISRKTLGTVLYHLTKNFCRNFEFINTTPQKHTNQNFLLLVIKELKSLFDPRNFIRLIKQ